MKSPLLIKFYGSEISIDPIHTPFMYYLTCFCQSQLCSFSDCLTTGDACAAGDMRWMNDFCGFNDIHVV